MKNILFCIFLLFYLGANAQGFSIELEGGTSLGLNKFIYTSEVSPYFRRRFVLGPSMGISFNRFSKRETATSYFSAYIGTYGQAVSTIIKKGKSYSSKATGDGGDLNFGLRWNYYGKNKLPYSRGIMLGININYSSNRYTNFPSGIGSLGTGGARKALYLDNVVQFTGINPGLQIGFFKGVKLRQHSYLRFALYGNIGFKATSYWYYRAVIESTEYTAVIKNKGDFINFSVCYGYWHKKRDARTLSN